MASTRKTWMTIFLVAVIVLFIMMEMDRTHGTVYDMNTYYLTGYKSECLLGAYNTMIRAASKLHPVMRHNTGIVSMDAFPNNYILKNNYEAIRQEALAIYDNYELPSFNEVNSVFDRISNDKWKVFVLKWYDDPLEQNCHQRCPITCSLLTQLPEVRCAMFSILLPGMHIPAHNGPFTGCLRYHLALSVPKDRDNCFIRVDKTKYHWKEGDDVLFDDTFEHEVYNDTNEIRIVLFADVVRPLSPPFSWLNNTLTNNAGFASFVKEMNSNGEKHVNLKLNDLTL